MRSDPQLVAGALHTYDWACASGGVLTPKQRRGLLPAIAQSYAAFIAGTATLPFRRRGLPIPPPPTIPDSKLIQVADEAARDQPEVVAGHGYRTWLFGGALAHFDELGLDPELFYVGALLHDAGIAEAVAGEDFTVRSADRAVAALDAAGDEPRPERRTTLADAIVSHTKAGLTVRDNPLGSYIQAGALLDLIGMRLWDLPRRFVQDVYTRHPQTGLRPTINKMIRAEARAVPGGRFSLLSATGFRLAIRFATTRGY